MPAVRLPPALTPATRPAMAPDPSPRPDRPVRAEPAPEISVVIPMRNEGPNVLPLIGEIAAALAGTPYEVVCVDDGSTDDTGARLVEAAGQFPVLVLRHAVACGQSAGIVSGVLAARAPWIATLDGDGQNDPADIPRLWARAQAESATDLMVAGHRTQRRDNRVKRVTSRLANAIRARLLGDRTPDTGCGLKVFSRALFLDLPRFDHMHRYLPALVLRAGGRVVSEPVNHRPRLRGQSNYGTLDRLGVAVSDMLGVIWLQRRWRRPVVERVSVRVVEPAAVPPAG
ncbi:glycosyltransferase family 2 protein [Falsiroseomonas sp. HC035]|uniref:glycosyltransferase family 2 protein n=1 Tax=Falsiroseomonas sp. HC035 TaxID=3390999 RepID=UPI003D3179C2